MRSRREAPALRRALGAACVPLACADGRSSAAVPPEARRSVAARCTPRFGGLPFSVASVYPRGSTRRTSVASWMRFRRLVSRAEILRKQKRTSK